MNSEIATLVKRAGLNNTQSIVYSYLIGNSKSLKELVVELGIPRTTLMEALSSLQLNNLIVSITKVGSLKKIYKTTQAANLIAYIDKKISRFSSEVSDLANIKESIQKYVGFYDSANIFGTNMEVFLGKKEVFNLYRSTISAKRIYGICKLGDYYSVFPKGLGLQTQANNLNKERQIKDILINDGSVKELEQLIKLYNYQNYKYKIVDELPSFTESGLSDIFITDTYTIFSVLKITPVAYKVNSPQISKFLQFMHQITWDSIRS